MRYHSAEVADIETYIGNDGWALEQKLDGIRCIVTASDGRVDFTGHAGNPLRSGMKHHAPIAAELAGMSFTLDGELMPSGELWVFDMLTCADNDLRGESFATRRSVLALLDGAFENIHVVPSATTADDKRTLWNKVRAINGEGVVAKRLTGVYSTGGRTRDVLKIKVTKTIDVIIIGFGGETDSAVLGLHDGAGNLVEIGKCSLIGKAAVEIGDVIEVQYLYVVDTATPRLVQGRMMRVRADKTPAECGWDQLDGATTSKMVVAA